MTAEIGGCICGPHLVAVIKAMAEFWDRLQEINDLAWNATLGLRTRQFEDEPTWAELYEAQVRELADHIEVLEIRGGDR